MMMTPDDDRENTRSDRDEETSAWVKGPGGWAAGAKGRHLTHLVYVTALFLIVIGIIYMHEQNTKERAATTQGMTQRGNDRVASLIEQSNKNQLLLTCIVSRPETERKSEFESPNSFCQRIAKP